MAYIFREMVRSRSRETSARGRKRRKGRFCSLRRQNWGKNEWPREGRRRYIDTCPRAPPEYRGLTRDHCEERWSLLSLINRPPTSPSFSSSCRGQIFHRVPVFPSIETSSASFSSTLLPFLLFPSLSLVLDRGIQQLSRRRKRLRERDQSSKRKREKTSTSSRRFLLLLSREVYGLGRVNWRESFVWKFSGRFLREVYLRDCLWGEANFATLPFLIGEIYQADYRKGVDVFDRSIFLYWFIGRLCLSLSQKFVINFEICSNLGKGRVVENLREF